VHALRLQKLQVSKTRSLAARGFLTLLTRLRRILLQDCALLQKTHPNHLIFKHDIFQMPAFVAFAERVRTNVDEAVHPREVILQQAMPQLADAIDAMRGAMGNKVADLQTIVRQETSSLRTDLIPVMERLGDAQKKNGMAIHVVSSALGMLAEGLRKMSTGVFETRLRLTDDHSGGTEDSSREKDTSSDALSELLSQLGKAGADSLQASADMTFSPRSNIGLSSNASGSSNPALVPASKVFVLEKNHATVSELWKEWKQGVFGRPSVEVMVNQGYTKSEAQRKLFSRRKVIIDEVIRLAKERTEPEDHVVTALDVYSSANKISISKLQEMIKERTKDGRTAATWLESSESAR
jgi:hypothetical protein